MNDHRKATFALQLQRATRHFMSIRFLALASTSQGAVSRPKIEMSGVVTLYRGGGWPIGKMIAQNFSVGQALRLLTEKSLTMPVVA